MSTFTPRKREPWLEHHRFGESDAYSPFTGEMWYDDIESMEWLGSGEDVHTAEIYVLAPDMLSESTSIAHGLLSQLNDALHENRNSDAQISTGTLSRARQLLANFPGDLPAPEIITHPDGEIALEWYVGPRQVFTLSIGSSPHISYAGLFGESKVHGQEVLHGGFPSILKSYIRRVVDE